MLIELERNINVSAIRAIYEMGQFAQVDLTVVEYLRCDRSVFF